MRCINGGAQRPKPPKKSKGGNTRISHTPQNLCAIRPTRMCYVCACIDVLVCRCGWLLAAHRTPPTTHPAQRVLFDIDTRKESANSECH